MVDFPDELVSKIRSFESEHPEITSFELANVVCFTHWGDRKKWDGVFFLEPEKKLMDLIESYGLVYPKRKVLIARDSPDYAGNMYEPRDFSWIQFISTFGSYYVSSHTKEPRFLDYLIKPFLRSLGINLQKMMDSLPRKYERTYIFTLGGDILQDSLFGLNEEEVCSAWGYRAGILGLRLLQKYDDNLPLLSNLIEEAYDQIGSVENEEYKKDPLFIKARNASDTTRIYLFSRYVFPKIKNIWDYIVSGKNLNRNFEILQ